MAHFRRTRGKAGHSSAALFDKKKLSRILFLGSWCKNWEVKDQSSENCSICNLDQVWVLFDLGDFSVIINPNQNFSNLSCVLKRHQTPLYYVFLWNDSFSSFLNILFMEEMSVPCLASCVDCLESFRSVVDNDRKRIFKKNPKILNSC